MVSNYLKNISQIGSFPWVGAKIKNVWNHRSCRTHRVGAVTRRQSIVSLVLWALPGIADQWIKKQNNDNNMQNTTNARHTAHRVVRLKPPPRTYWNIEQCSRPCDDPKSGSSISNSSCALNRQIQHIYIYSNASFPNKHTKIIQKSPKNNKNIQKYPWKDMCLVIQFVTFLGWWVHVTLCKGFLVTSNDRGMKRSRLESPCGNVPFPFFLNLPAFWTQIQDLDLASPNKKDATFEAVPSEALPPGHETGKEGREWLGMSGF